MKISQVKISNFRGYNEETSIDFNNLTVFVGKNDVGKSTIIEALDVFFNESKGTIKLDKEDINKQGLANGNNDIRITVVFEDLPSSLVIDSTNETTLGAEYLLNCKGKLEVVKTYPNAGKEKVAVRANHPSNPACADLLLKKQKDLQAIIKKESIACEDEKKNAVMRKADGYHNELYGYIESEGWLTEFKNGKPTRGYQKECKGKVSVLQIALSEHIRHQIHHPENTLNQRFATAELGQSIIDMRTFIVGKQNA